MLGRILFENRWSVRGGVLYIALSLVGLLEDLHCLSLVHVLSLFMRLMKPGLLFLLLLDPLCGECLESRSDERGRLALLMLLLSLLLSDLVGLDLSLKELDLLVLGGQQLLLIGKVDAIGVDPVVIGFWKTD